MHRVVQFIDALTELLGGVAAWLYFATGLIISYEVVARYLLNAPTIWAQEISQLMLLWGTFLGISWALRNNKHIRIGAIDSLLGDRARKALRFISLVFICLLCTLVIYFGFDIFWDSYVRGRSTGTMLNIPNWWAESVIPVGFTILLLQAAAEIFKLAIADSPDHQ